MLRPAEPGQIYEDLVSNGFASARFHFCRSSFSKVCGFQSRGGAFFRANHHVCINDTRKCNKCQTFFAKIVKMLTINHILHEFRFFVKLFLKKILDDSVVLISVVRDRLSPNGLGSGDPNLQGGAVGNVNDENVPLFCSLRSPDRKQVKIRRA